MKKLLLVGGAILGILGLGALILVSSVVGMYNNLVQLKEQVPAQWSQVENTLQRRNDLIPNLVATVKGYSKHEQKVYGDVAKALAAFNRATTTAGKLEASDSLTGLLKGIISISLQYPEIKADAQFARLSDELAGTENRIAVERMRYNQAIQAYNSTLKTFPTNLVARFGGFQPVEEYFKAEPAAKVAPKVAF